MPHVDIPMKISFRRLHPEAPVPSQAHPGDAGWDLTSSVRAAAAGRAAVPTGIALAIPRLPGLYCRGAAMHEARRESSTPGLTTDTGEITVLLIKLRHDPVPSSRATGSPNRIVRHPTSSGWRRTSSTTHTGSEDSLRVDTF